MKLFTIGPVQMHPETLEVRKMAIPYFRTKEFSDFTFEMDRKFKQVIGNGAGVAGGIFDRVRN